MSFIEQPSGLIKITCINSYVKTENRFKNWLEQNSTKNILQKISQYTNLPTDMLFHIESRNPRTNTTDAHYLLACEYIEYLPVCVKNIIKPRFQAFLNTLKLKYEIIEENTIEELKENDMEIQPGMPIQPQITHLNQIFKFNNKEIRVLGTIDKPWFIAKEIAELLEYKNTMKAIRDHVQTYEKTTLGEINMGEQNVLPINMQLNTILINESGLYRLTFKSKMKAAEKFTEWVVSDVLPSIRKSGFYNIPIQIQHANQHLLEENPIIINEHHFEFLIAQKGYIERLITEFELNSQYGRRSFEELRTSEKNLFYMAFIGIYEDPMTKQMVCWIKFGWTGNGQKRENTHTRIILIILNYSMFWSVI
jgi:prophage antirepressor-like protein